MTPIEEAADLARRGYRRTSHKHRMVSRIDRPDWKERLAAHLGRSVAELYRMRETNPDRIGNPGYEVGDTVSPLWCDFYRRVLSRDTLTVSEEVAKLVPGSGWDPCEYVELPEPVKQFLYCESQDGGMESFVVGSAAELATQLYGWMSNLHGCKQADTALVEWMKTAEVGDMHEHRLGVIVRLRMPE